MRGVAAGWRGELLPDAPYEAWTQEPRRRVHARLPSCCAAEDWERVLAELDPTDEAACRELMRAAIEAGQRHVAIRSYERLRVALVRELGLQPRPRRGLSTSVHRGRAPRRARVRRARGGAGRGGGASPGAVASGAAALLVRGPTGFGKSALCREVSAARASAAGA